MPTLPIAESPPIFLVHHGIHCLTPWAACLGLDQSLHFAGGNCVEPVKKATRLSVARIGGSHSGGEFAQAGDCRELEDVQNAR